MGISEQAGAVAHTAVEAMRSVPLAIALLLVNVGFLAFAAYVLGQVAANAAERNKTQAELISVLVQQIRECRPAPTRTRSPVFLDTRPASTGGAP
jgi:hypothetical protein